MKLTFLAKFPFNTTSERSKLMSKIRGKGTKPEMALRRELWKLGLRYRVNARSVKGTPDVVFKKYKVAVFVDGEFWHGYDWAEKKHKIKTNSKYWINKIERNMERDREHNAYLVSKGYTVLRFWENEIKKDLSGCTLKIIAAIANRKSSS